MEKSAPYLAIYNANKHSQLTDVNNTQYRICLFEHKVFNQELCDAIITATELETPVIIINADAQLPKYWLARLTQPFAENNQLSVCSALSCHINELSPLVKGDVFEGSVAELDSLVYLLQSASTVFTDSINTECFIIKNNAHLKDLARTPFVACNNLLVQSNKGSTVQLTQDKDLGDQKPLPAHALAGLQWRLKPHLSHGFKTEAYPLLDAKPVILHINMGWGGGVHQWIDDYCQNEDQYHHLILSSDGELYRQRHGESFALHYQHTQGVIMQRFEMQSPIKSTCLKHAEYKTILDHLIQQYQIQQVIVSSLIGHSLECLETGIATVRVLHDYFPSWPSLLANLDKETLNDIDLNTALEQSALEPFGQLSKQEYLLWRNKLHACYQSDLIELVAPSQSVVDNLSKIDADAFNKVTVIPHAIAKFPPIKYQNTDKPFQILVLGRINPAKGQDLLEEIMKKLGDDYYFVFIGAGNEGKKYLNNPKITVIMDYKNAELDMLLQELEPDLALITSQTSETFNYTLSELQQAGICTISTKLGALKNRIIDGQSGMLCDNNADSFVATITKLRKDPDLIKSIRNYLKTIEVNSFSDVIESYRQLFSKTHNAQYALIPIVDNNIFAKKLLALDIEKQRVTSILNVTEEKLDERTKWGKKLTKELKQAAKNIDLERAESKHLLSVVKSVSENLQETDKKYKKVGQKLYDTQFEKEKIEQALSLSQQELSTVYQSRSWRVTKPMRKLTTWARHKRNAIKFRLAQLKTFPSRAIRSLKTRGVSGTAGVIKGKISQPKAHKNEHKVVTLTQDFKPITFNRIDKPIVSIIIPVYNHFEHTYNCLKSIAEFQDKTSFEIIVVDDCSTDDTQKRIKKISGITYQRQKQNGGFIESCNTGAKLAKGQYLMFLNNDTVVYDNWLGALIDVFDHFPDAGLVGSKLVYPNGQLQEAGGIVFSDASGWNYGRLGIPDEPWYNHIREVDYCSGASILIANELFIELGYFDERYKPAYYEDTDLAFAVRHSGKKVYYQPASKITHFEGISSGTDLTQGMKKYQVINQTKFKEKWAIQLAQQPKPGTEIELCRVHGQPKRILILDACTPTPDQDSGSLRMVNLIKILKALNYHIIFMPENLSHNQAYTESLQQLGVECVYTPHITNPVDYLKQKGQFLDVVMLSRYYVAEPVMPFIRDYCPKAQIIFDTVDLHYIRERRMAELSNDKKLAKMAESTKEKELAVAEACDVTLVVSPYEVEVLAKDRPDLTVKVLSNIHEIYGCRKPYNQRKDIMFIGGYQHTPNVDAVEWFVTKIFPLIEKELPDLKFHIIGSKAPKHIQAMVKDNIIFQGFVEDIEPIMDDIRIAVAPLRYGAGVKGKVNMSMSYGQPVVGTKVAVEGMFTQDEKDCLMAETPEEFAKQVIRLYQDEDLWNTVSQGGLDNVQNFFSFDAAKLAIKDLFD